MSDDVCLSIKQFLIKEKKTLAHARVNFRLKIRVVFYKEKSINLIKLIFYFSCKSKFESPFLSLGLNKKINLGLLINSVNQINNLFKSQEKNILHKSMLQILFNLYLKFTIA
ncbi:hypothetical protein BpHYR1_024899 [Brachionus plicatilis]|uniref:Uncharacterized protein n=1 Tax=Brachionus plicatilis TaxID=10195 RepID=A0A3M7QAU3_BRAPC|nr:hypothetical protein BpHYR1_024899 [Brachionus plicatilis]